MKARTIRRRALELTARRIATPPARRDYNPAMTRRSEDREWRDFQRAERFWPRSERLQDEAWEADHED